MHGCDSPSTLTLAALQDDGPRAFILKTLAGVIAKAHHSLTPLAFVEATVKQTTTEMGFVMTSMIAWDRTMPVACAMDPVPSTSVDAVVCQMVHATVQVKPSSINAVFVVEMERVA